LARYMGVDLSGPRRRSAYALMDDDFTCSAGHFFANGELLGLVEAEKPLLVAVDAPLSLPSRGYMRLCDEAMARLGLKPLPPLLGGMRVLTERGVALRAALEEAGYTVIEVFPGGAKKILGLPRKSVEGLRRGLEGIGVKLVADAVDMDVLDAVVAAFTALSYARGRYFAVETEECRVVFPLPPRDG